MRIIKTHEIDPLALTGWERDQVYNGLDVGVTADVLANLLPQLDETAQRTYEFSKALQGPVLEMRLRGCLVDQARKMEVIDEFWEQSEVLESNLSRIVSEGVGMPMFNWRSPKDLRELFYSQLGLPAIRKGSVPTVDRGAREKLAAYPIAHQLIKHINVLTELGDKISVLRTNIDPDGRIRTSYNIAGTSTGRFSSSLSEFGTGGNLQNIEESLRSIFVADPGHKLAKFDAKSGESFVVGAIEWNLFGDPRYLRACESGDPHTAVARLCWPKLGWSGDLKLDKDIAKQRFYRHLSYRDACKRIGHGSNYLGGAEEISNETRVPIDIVRGFQRVYFETFPSHRAWHSHVDATLRKTGTLTTLTGRRRRFFKRRNDPKTLKEAIAFDPQGSLADIVNGAMLKVWRQGLAIVMFQDHDAITFMYPEADEPRIIPLLQSNLITPIPLASGRMLTIPYDCEVGWNKGKYNASTNPDGLIEWTGHDSRRRTPQVSLMDRVFHKLYRKSPRAGNLPQVDGDQPNGGSNGAEGLDTDLESTLPEPLGDDSGAPWGREDQGVEGG